MRVRMNHPITRPETRLPTERRCDDGRENDDVPEFALGMTESIEDAVGDVEQPGAEGEKKRLDEGQAKMHGADKEPRPESGDGGSIQA